MLDGTWGVLEHVAVTSTGTDTGPYVMYIDNVTNDTTNFGTMESFTAGDQVFVQEPTFSGTTSGNLLNSPDVSMIDDTIGDASAKSVRVEWQFRAESTTQWVRLTTNGTGLAGLPNPEVDLTKPISLRVRLAPAGPVCNTPPQDAVGDGDVDIDDFAAFSLCFNGSAKPYGSGGSNCDCFDTTLDGDVDIDDFATFSLCFNGSAKPPGGSCP